MILAMIFPLVIMAIMFGLFIWQAVWVAMDSRKKGEEYWWLWTIAALVAFPVGLIVYVLVTRSDRCKCNNCGKEVPHNVNSCPYCGEKCGLFCPNCGQKVEAQWRYCPSCTTELPEEIKNAKKLTKSNNKVVIIIICIAVAVFLFIGIMFIGSFTFNNMIMETEYSDFESWNEIGGEYDTEYTDIRTYTSNRGVNSVQYHGTRKSGEIIIRILDSEDKVISESKPIKDKEINDIFISDNGLGNKIQIEYKDFKGKFYFSF